MTEISVNSEDNIDSPRVAILPSQSNMRAIKGGVSSANLSKSERFRGVTRSLTTDAISILDEMWKDCQKTPEMQEKYFQLYHCLDCLKRFCDGKF